MNPTMFGIPNCNNIKKAQDWLTEHDVAYTFHNYKKDGISPTLLSSWAEQVGWEVLLNKRGTTWRKLAESEQADVGQAKAIQLMVDYPSMIKRPILVVNKHVLVGFDTAHYAEVFS